MYTRARVVLLYSTRIGTPRTTPAPAVHRVLEIHDELVAAAPSDVCQRAKLFPGSSVDDIVAQIWVWAELRKADHIRHSALLGGDDDKGSIFYYCIPHMGVPSSSL